MIVRIYYSERESSYTVILKDEDPYIFSGDAEFIKEIEGLDWNDCMKQYHEFMGWEPYKPEIKL